MSVAVYPWLGTLLRERDLTVAELGRQISLRFGLVVDSASLDRWANDAPVQRANLKLAGAAAAILEVSLSDLFEIDLRPGLPAEEPIFDPAGTERLSELLELQQAGELSRAQEDEIEALLAEYSREIQERGVIATAARRGISVAQARGELRAELDEACQWWEAFQADPERRRAVVDDLQRRNRRATSRT